MDRPRIIIVHPDGGVVTEIRQRLQSAGYDDPQVCSDFSDVKPDSNAVLLVDSRLWEVKAGLFNPTVIVAPPDYILDCGALATSVPLGIVYQPLREHELENAIEVVQRRAEISQDRRLIHTMRQYGLFMLDQGGRIVTWNPGAIEVHGYQPDEILGKHYSLLYCDDDRERGVPEAELRTAEREGYADDTRWLRHRNGEGFWVEGLTTAIKEGGQVIGFAKLTRDATERRKLEMKLERSNDELQRFAYTVSHDLQEPLRTIRSYAELLTRRYAGKLDSDADEFIHFMMDAAGRMSQLLRDLLAYSQAGRRDRGTPELTSSANILQWAIMNIDRLIKESDAKITYDPLPKVEADQTELSQVFQNLLGNAIKYRSVEPPAIHISAVHMDDFYEFAVQDNGIGVDPEHHERIFGVFKRLHGKDVPGTGIGLAICRKIIESYGGRIWIESQPRQGATVKFTLPAHD